MLTIWFVLSPFMSVAAGGIVKRKYKPIEELSIRDNFMFVKVFSDEEIAKPFLKALLKVEIEKIHLRVREPRKKRSLPAFG